MTNVHSRPLDSSVFAFSSFLSRITGKNSKYNEYLKYALIIAGMVIPGGIGIVKYLQFKRKLDREIRTESSNTTSTAGGKKKSSRGSLDRQFFARLKMLLSIVVPSYRYDITIVIVVMLLLLLQLLYYYIYIILYYIIYIVAARNLLLFIHIHSHVHSCFD